MSGLREVPAVDAKAGNDTKGDDLTPPGARSGIYAITNVHNGMRYVGSAVNIRRRWNRHRKELQFGAHYNNHLQRAWDKHGQDAFIFSVIEECSRECLLDREQAAINFKADYNHCRVAGSQLGFKQSKATVEKRALSLKSIFSDPEYRARLSVRKKQALTDPRYREKLSLAAKRRWENKDAIKRQSDTAKAQWNNAAARERFSAESKARWADPNLRAKMLAATKLALSTPEVRAKIVDAQKAAWANPDLLVRQAAISKAKWADPDYREKVAAGIAARSLRKLNTELP